MADVAAARARNEAIRLRFFMMMDRFRRKRSVNTKVKYCVLLYLDICGMKLLDNVFGLDSTQVLKAHLYRFAVPVSESFLDQYSVTKIG